MPVMEDDLPRPDRDRLSALIALVVLTYGLIRVISLPSVTAEFTALGLVVKLEFGTRVVMLSLASAVAAAGCDWLVRSHPHAAVRGWRVEHWIIPGLAAFGAGAILTRLPQGPGLWVGLPVAAGLLVGVVAAEFIVIDEDDPRRESASLGLTVLAYLLLLGTFFTGAALGVRLVFTAPLVLVVSSAAVWRVLRMTDAAQRIGPYAIGIGLATAQLAVALHYWPLNPLRYALILGLAAYAAQVLVQAHLKGAFAAWEMIELSAVVLLSLGAIFVLA